MAKRYIITLMAANRVGILASVTTALDELGGDLHEVSQTVMQGFFTIILAAEFPEQRKPAVIVDHIRDICRPFGVEVCLKDPDAVEHQNPSETEVEKYILTTSGKDQPGVIRQIAHRLAQEGIDVVDLYAVRHDKDRSFVSVMELAVPFGVDAIALQRDLERLGEQIGLSATLQHEDIFVATNDPRPVRVSLLRGISKRLGSEVVTGTMERTEDILSTLQMVQQENLDVRTVTMGINLAGCVDRNLDNLCRAIYDRITSAAERLDDVCRTVSSRYGIPIVNRRLSVTPIARVAHGFRVEELLHVARTLDGAAAHVNVDLIGGFSAMVHGGMTSGARHVIESLPNVLAQTERVCASFNVATSRAGINMDAVALLGQKLREVAAATADRDGFGAAKLVIFANAPEDNPFMAGAFLGEGAPDVVIHIGVSGPGVVARALERLHELEPGCPLNEIAEEVKSTAFRVTRVGELIGREVAARLGVAFGIVDLSLAPTPKMGDSIGEIIALMGVETVGAPGSTAAVAMMNDAVKKGGLFASSSVGGLSGAFIPVMEDATLAAAARSGALTLEKLEALTSVCSVGLDMIPLPGDTDAATLAAIIADEMAIGVYNNKTTAARLIPVPGKRAGELVSFGGLFGESVIVPIHAAGKSARFIEHAGRIPAPLQSLRN